MVGCELSIGSWIRPVVIDFGPLSVEFIGHQARVFVNMKIVPSAHTYSLDRSAGDPRKSGSSSFSALYASHVVEKLTVGDKSSCARRANSGPYCSGSLASKAGACN